MGAWWDARAPREFSSAAANDPTLQPVLRISKIRRWLLLGALVRETLEAGSLSERSFLG
jgi:hypothetical protein